MPYDTAGQISDHAAGRICDRAIYRKDKMLTKKIFAVRQL